MQGQLSVSRPTPRETLADWLTVERAAYAGIAALALGLRLYGLGRVPLGPAEAVQALPAWAAAAGQPYDLAGVSPLLFGLQWLLFALFGAGDAVARFWPAVIGGLAPLLFYTLRDRLTRGGALIGGLLWAISGVAVFTGRLGLGDSLVAPLALALMAAVNIWARRRQRQRRPGRSSTGTPLRWAAVALGLLLISGPAAYTALLAGLIAALWWHGALPALWSSVKADRRGVSLAFLVPLVLGATSFFLAPTGLAAAADLLGRWLLGLRPGADRRSGTWEILYRLLLSEPLLVGFGVAGLIWALLRRDRFGVWAGMAAGVALLVPLLGRGRHPVDLALVVLALTLLAGPGDRAHPAPHPAVAGRSRALAPDYIEPGAAEHGGPLLAQRLDPGEHCRVAPALHRHRHRHCGAGGAGVGGVRRVRQLADRRPGGAGRAADFRGAWGVGQVVALSFDRQNEG